MFRINSVDLRRNVSHNLYYYITNDHASVIRLIKCGKNSWRKFDRSFSRDTGAIGFFKLHEVCNNATFLQCNKFTRTPNPGLQWKCTAKGQSQKIKSHISVSKTFNWWLGEQPNPSVQFCYFLTLKPLLQYLDNIC